MEEIINTIQLGDCFDIFKKIEDKSIDCVYVDVPYLYTLGGSGHSDLCKDTVKSKMELMGLGKYYNKDLSPQDNMKILYRMREEKKIAGNSKNKDKNLVNSNITTGFDYETFFKEAFRVMKKCNMFVWCSPMQIQDFMNEISKYTNSTISILVWCKSNPIPTTNNNWLSDVEYCLYVREEGIKLNDGYELKSKYFVSAINQQDKKHWNHPTIKPLELVKRHLLHATQENDLVLDCFCGSGTTCVASKEIGRRYIGVEIDETYWETANNRISGYDDNGQMSIFAFDLRADN